MRKIIFAVTVLSMVGVSSIALAEGNLKPIPFIKSAVPQELRTGTTTKPKELGEDRRLGSTTIPKMMQDMMRMRKLNRYNLMVTRIKATIDREQEILNKINSRIVKVKNDGKNTSDAEGFVKIAQTDITHASTTLATLSIFTESAITEDISSTTGVSKGNLEGMKKTTKQIEKDLQDAHKNLEKAIRNLMKLYNIGDHATTTPENKSNDQ